jgi:lipopolysaccharide export system protein LptA
MIRRLVLALVLALPLMAAGPADPVKVTGDSFVVDDQQRLATFSGNVIATRKNFTLWAPKVVVDYGEGGPQSITSFTATGGVRIKTPDQDATGDKAVYDPRTKLLRLTGHVMVISASGTVGSPDLVVNLETNKSVFTGGSGGRVTGVFTPKP